MTVNKIIECLQAIQSDGYGDCNVYAEGEPAEKVLL